MHVGPVDLHVEDVREREPAADRRDAVPLDEGHERALVAGHDLERVVGAARVLPHEHGQQRPGLRVDRDDRGVLAADADGVDGRRGVGVRGGDLPHGVDQRRPQLLGVLLGDVAGAASWATAVGRRPRLSPSPRTRATLTFVVPTSIPSAHPDVSAISAILPGSRAALSGWPQIVRPSNGSVSWRPWPTPRADLTRATRALALAARALERAAGARDLTLAQYRVLSLIAAGDERSSLLAERLAVAKPTITAVVDGLVERGFVAREAVAGDRRSIRLALTPDGPAALRAAEDAMGETLGRILEHARDRDALVAALLDLDDALAARMQARLRAACGEVAP